MAITTCLGDGKGQRAQAGFSQIHSEPIQHSQLGALRLHGTAIVTTVHHHTTTLDNPTPDCQSAVH
jgi:hypothetical protein